jgi:hypothetical protein
MGVLLKKIRTNNCTTPLIIGAPVHFLNRKIKFTYSQLNLTRLM